MNNEYKHIVLNTLEEVLGEIKALKDKNDYTGIGEYFDGLRNGYRLALNKIEDIIRDSTHNLKRKQ